jgi:anti-anti-sigma factor
VEPSVAIDNGCAVITLSGRIDWEAAQALDRIVQENIEKGLKRLAFNLDKVTYLCSGGVGVLVYSLNQLRGAGGAVYLIASSTYMDHMFETMKFDVVFRDAIFPTLDAFRANLPGTKS